MFKHIILFLLYACWGEETSSWQSLQSIAKKADPSFSVVLAEKLMGGQKCENENKKLSFGKGCSKIYRVKVNNLEFAFVEFDSVENAKNEAVRLKQFQYQNWVFDEVYKEEPLEEFVRKAFDAKSFEELN